MKLRYSSILFVVALHFHSRKVFSTLEQIRRSRLSCGFRMEIDGVVAMVRGLAEGVGLDLSKLSNYTPFYLKVAKRLEHFYRYTPEAPSNGMKKRKGAPVELSGGAALAAKLMDVQALIKSGNGVEVATMKFARVYDWVLTDTQRTVREELMKSILQQVRPGLQSIEDKQLCEDAVADGLGASSSMTTPETAALTPARPELSALAMIRAAGPSADKGKGCSKKTPDTTALMKFFVSKKGRRSAP